MNRINSKSKSLKDYHRLVLKQERSGEFVPFYVQIFTNNKDFDNLSLNFNYYNIGSKFDGFINLYDLAKERSAFEKIEKGKKAKSSLTAKEGEYATCLYFGWWYEDGRFEVISTLGCSGVSGGSEGGSGGVGSSGVNASNTNQPSLIPNKEVLIELIESADPEAFDFTFVKNQNTAISTLKVKLLPWAGIMFSISQQTGSVFVVKSVSSEAYGLTLGYSWNQGDYGVSVSGSVTNITINGILGYTLFVDGVGTVYSEPLSYRISLNYRTGRIVSAIRM